MVSFVKKATLCFATALLVLIATAGSADAQQVFGRIFGTVTDASGGAVANARVTITDQSKGTQFEVTSNESGNYDKGQLIPGTYGVVVEAPGFSKQSFKDIQVLVDAAARVDSALQPGNVATTVEVTAAVPTLQADRADVSTTFTSQTLIDLPSLGRNAQAYELLTPGTTRIGFNHASSEDPQGSAQISVNGQHFSGTGFQLDGTENQDPILGIVVINPNIDSLAEQKISAQDYDAEFGYAGAGIQNASTRSGTNSLHFTAFDYFRNNSPGFTTFARDPFAEPKGAPPFKFNQFGGSIGGRIIKDKLFFFGDAELVRQRLTGAVQTNVPTALARQGNFSQYLAANPLNQIYDPQSGTRDANGNFTGQNRTPFVGNIIPTPRLSQQALNVLNYFPAPNQTPSNPLNPNYLAQGNDAFDSNKWDTREDYFMNEKTTIYGRYSNHQFQRSAVGAFGSVAGGPAFNGVNFAGNSFVRNQSISLGTTHTFNPTLVNELRFGYVKYNVQTTPNGVGTAPATAAGIPGLNLADNYYTSGLPYFNFRTQNDDQLTALGYALGANQCNCPLTENEGQYQVTDNLSKTLGNHSLKFGADIRYAKNLRVPSDSHRAGELTFNTARTALVNASGNTQGGLSYATFLLGDVTGFTRYVSNTTNAAEHQRRWFFYGQDSWRITSKLTVNYGLRWELVFPERVNGAGNGAQLDLSTGLINVFGVGQVSNHGVQNMNYKNFAPRLGLAYQLTPKTVIRAGYGWAYELGTFGATFGHNVTQQPPVLYQDSPTTDANGAAFGRVFSLATGPNAPRTFVVNSNGQFLLPPGVGGKARPTTTVLPRVMAYNFTVEQQIAPSTSVSVGYVGNVARHVSTGTGNGFNINANQPAYIPALSNNQNAARPYFAPYGWTQDIDFYCMCLTNSYNSLQATLKRNFAKGYGIQLNYTWQDAQSDNDNYAVLYNRALGRGRSPNIPDHQITASQNWDIPFGRGRAFGNNAPKIVDLLAGGWNISGVTSFYSGLPITPNLNGFSRPYTGPSGRPDVGTGDPYAANQSRDGWLNVGPNGTLSSAFVVPSPTSFGNYGFNTLRGPIFINQDLSVAKNFHVTERLRYQIRGEAYNVFNHTNLATPNTNVNGNNAGIITAIAYGSNMRRMQFAMRLDF